MADSEDFFRLADALLNRCDGKRWHELVRHVMPELIPASELCEMEDDYMPERICGRARTDLLKLASAHINYITPRGQSWFSFAPPMGREASEEARDWYSRATKRVRLALEKSNFYSAQIAAVIDRCATGCGLLLAEEAHDGLRFSHIPAGTYALAENDRHEVDTVVRKFAWSAHQAAAAFGEDALSASMLNALRSNESRFKEQFELLHLVTPRNVADKGGVDVPELDRQWVSVYLDPRDHKILSIGGYYEFPYLVSRFLKYGNKIYGTGALSSLRDVINDSLCMADALKVAAQRAAIPSVLVSASLAGELDLRGGGMTVMRDADWANPPQVFAPAGQYAIGKDLLDIYNAEIDDALFITVLQTVSGNNRQMTATEVNARESERLMTFSQTFAQFAADFEPFMRRIFACCFRAGLLPENPPFEVIRITAAGGKRIAAPDVSYVGLLAKALKRSEYSGLINTMQIAMQFSKATGDPEALDFVKVGESLRYVADEEMAPETCLRTPEEIEIIRQQRQEAAAMQQQMQMTMQQAQANAAQSQADMMESNSNA